MFVRPLLVTLIIALLLAPLSLMTLSLAIEVFAGLRPLREPNVTPVASARVAIIVPAHDEERYLEKRLAALKSAAGDQAGILLVADNCSDSTANIARSIGVSVI